VLVDVTELLHNFKGVVGQRDDVRLALHVARLGCEATGGHVGRRDGLDLLDARVLGPVYDRKSIEA